MNAFIGMRADKPYNKFYTNAVSQHAYSNVIAALKIVSEHEDEFRVCAIRMRSHQRHSCLPDRELLPAVSTPQ